MKWNTFRFLRSHGIAVLALFVAVGGTAGAAGSRLLTGADIRNGTLSGADIETGSLTGSDIRSASLSGRDIRDGSITLEDFAADDRKDLVGARGDTGPQGQPGPKGDPGPTGSPATLQSLDATGSDVTNYQNGAALVTTDVPAAGYYLAIANAVVTNTGAVDEYLNCGFDIAGSVAGAAGFETTAGNATTGSSVTLAPVTAAHQQVKFVCFGIGATTYDIADLKMKLIKLADWN